MLAKKRKLMVRLLSFLSFSFFTITMPSSLTSCSKKSNDESFDEERRNKGFFNDIINNTSYYFSFHKDNYFSQFNLQNDYSISLKCQKDKIDEFKKQKKIFLKFECPKKFYLEKIGTIFCLPLITKKNNTWINENIKDRQKDLFEFPANDTNNGGHDDGETKEIIIEFSKEEIEKINNGVNFDVGQNKYEMIFIVSIFSKTLSFKEIGELEKQKNDIGAKNANIFLHLKLEKY